MKKSIFLLIALFCVTIAKGQAIENKLARYIEVTGSAEMEVEPDEIRLVIGIEEYWKEEFEKGSKPKDYTTKIPLTTIEEQLLNELFRLGINRDNIIAREVGNYWRERGEDFLMSKEFEISISNFKKVDDIVKSISTKGIDHVYISESKHKDIALCRKQVKIQALKSAKEKAEYMLVSIEKQLGDVISIEEVENNNTFWQPRSMLSNSVMSSSDNSGIDNFRKIKLRYEVKASFEIK